MPTPEYYLDTGLNTLRQQLKILYPRIVVGWIGDVTHQTENPTSDHNPEADGSVDAIDPMLGASFTHEYAQELWEVLIDNKDHRIKYIIWNRQIVYSTPRNGYEAWQPQPYKGKDPHTGHMHISANDLHETDSSRWDLTVHLSNSSVIAVANLVVSKLNLEVNTDEIADAVIKKLGSAPIGPKESRRTLGGSINALVSETKGDFVNPLYKELNKWTLDNQAAPPVTTTDVQKEN